MSGVTAVRRLAVGLCGRCGERPPQTGQKQCEECAIDNVCYHYGITREEYDAMFRRQRGLCGVCGDPLGDKRPEVDHVPGTKPKVVRSLVHRECNLQLSWRERWAALSPERQGRIDAYLAAHGPATSPG
jgi:5-methylcytosine-specific restriction endonuclease McrA